MIAVLLIALVACGDDDGPRPARDAGGDAAIEADAGPDDAGAERDAGEEDAGALPDAGPRDAGPRPPDAGGCLDTCPLPLEEQPSSCAGACRVRDCNTYCGDVHSPSAGYRDACEGASECRRGLQCLARDMSAEGTCFAFCRIGDDAYCDGLRGGSTCVRYDDLRTPEDDVRVVLPAGFGVCR